MTEQDYSKDRFKEWKNIPYETLAAIQAVDEILKSHISEEKKDEIYKIIFGEERKKPEIVKYSQPPKAGNCCKSCRKWARSERWNFEKVEDRYRTEVWEDIRGYQICYAYKCTCPNCGAVYEYDT